MKTFAPTATFDDVNLILRLYEMRREPRMRDARAVVRRLLQAEDDGGVAALCPPGSEANASFRMVTSYWEMVGSFLTSGVLNAVLFYQSGRELLFAWERVKRPRARAPAEQQEPARVEELRAGGGGLHRVVERAGAGRLRGVQQARPRIAQAAEEDASMSDADKTVVDLFMAFSRDKLIGQYWPRLRGAVESLTDEQVWWRPNEASNSVGNLILHLNGNVKQWLVASFSGREDLRNRPAEFAGRDTIPAARAAAHARRDDARGAGGAVASDRDRPPAPLITFRATRSAGCTPCTRSSSTSACTTARSSTSRSSFAARTSASTGS